jgi:carboxyl-terminal processing protease
MTKLIRFAVVLSLLAVSTSVTVTSPAQAQALHCQNMPALMAVFVGNHYSMNSMSSEVKKRTVDLFLKFVDPNKQLLFKADVDRISKQLYDLFETMKNGNCSALVDISNVLVARSLENQKIVTDRLKAEFKVNESVRYQTDTKKRVYPANLDEKKKMLEDALHTQIATIMAGDVKLEKAKTQLLKRYDLSIKRSKEMNQGKMINLFMESFAHGLDPHSDYMPQEQLEEFKISMNLSLEGIGVSLSSEDGYTTVQEIMPGGSADRAKALQPKDKIIAVAQDGKEAVSIVDMDLSDVVKMIRGKKGTKVTLTVVRQKGGSSNTFNVTIVRDKVDMKEQAAKLEYIDYKIGQKKMKIAVIDLPSFYGGNEKNSRDCYDDMKRLVTEANEKKVDGMILDLSTNGGGLLQDAVKIAGLFIKTGSVVATIDGKKSRDILSDEEPKVAYSGPLMILTTRQSASASEILAGAMKDYKRALIVGGDHTYGKGSVQVLHQLPLGLGAMKLTTQMFYLPGGVSTQFGGVSADVAMPTYLDIDDLGEQYMDYALPPAKTEPFIKPDLANSANPVEAWKPVTADVVKGLKEKSSKRVADHAEFKEIVKDLEETKQNDGWLKVADILKKSDKDKDKRKEKKEKSNTAKGRRELWLNNPFIQESINIMKDWLATASGATSLSTK